MTEVDSLLPRIYCIQSNPMEPMLTHGRYDTTTLLAHLLLKMRSFSPSCGRHGSKPQNSAGAQSIEPSLAEEARECCIRLPLARAHLDLISSNASQPSSVSYQVNSN
jgi:hypothetical protein